MTHARLRKRLKKQRGKARRRGEVQEEQKLQALIKQLDQFKQQQKKEAGFNGHTHSHHRHEVVAEVEAQQAAVDASAIDLSKVSREFAAEEPGVPAEGGEVGEDSQTRPAPGQEAQPQDLPEMQVIEGGDRGPGERLSTEDGGRVQGSDESETGVGGAAEAHQEEVR